MLPLPSAAARLRRRQRKPSEHASCPKGRKLSADLYVENSDDIHNSKSTRTYKEAKPYDKERLPYKACAPRRRPSK